MIDDVEMAEALDRWDGLKPLKKEYDDLDKMIKGAFKEKSGLLVGEYLIDGKWIQTKEQNYTKPG